MKRYLASVRLAEIMVNKETKLTHLGLVLPGIGNRLIREPNSVDDILKRVIYWDGYPDHPNFLSPRTVVQKAHRTEAGIPLITAFFSR